MRDPRTILKHKISELQAAQRELKRQHENIRQQTFDSLAKFKTYLRDQFFALYSQTKLQASKPSQEQYSLIKKLELEKCALSAEVQQAAFNTNLLLQKNQQLEAANALNLKKIKQLEEARQTERVSLEKMYEEIIKNISNDKADMVKQLKAEFDQSVQALQPIIDSIHSENQRLEQKILNLGTETSPESSHEVSPQKRVSQQRNQSLMMGLQKMKAYLDELSFRNNEIQNRYFLNERYSGGSKGIWSSGRKIRDSAEVGNQEENKLNKGQSRGVSGSSPSQSLVKSSDTVEKVLDFIQSKGLMQEFGALKVLLEEESREKQRLERDCQNSKLAVESLREAAKDKGKILASFEKELGELMAEHNKCKEKIKMQQLTISQLEFFKSKYEKDNQTLLKEKLQLQEALSKVQGTTGLLDRRNSSSKTEAGTQAASLQEKEVMRLKKQSKELQAACLELTNQLQEAASVIDKLDSENKILTEEIKLKEQAIEQAKSNYSKVLDEIEAFRQASSTSKQKMQEQMESFKSKINEKAQVSEMLKDRNSQEQAKALQESEINKLYEQINEMTLQIHRVEELNRQLQSKLKEEQETFELEKQKLLQQRDEQIKIHEKDSKDIPRTEGEGEVISQASHEKEIKELLEKISAAEKESMNLRTQVSMLENELKDQKARFELELKERLENLEDKKENKSESSESSEESSETSLEEHDKKQKSVSDDKIKEHEARLIQDQEELRRKISELQNEIHEMKEKKNVEEQKLFESARLKEEEISALKERINSLETKEKELKLLSETSQEELQKKLNELESLHQSSQQKEEELREAQSRIQEIQTQLEAAEKENDHLRKNMQDNNPRIQDLEQKAELLQKERDSLEQRNQQIQAELKTVADKLAEEEQQKAQLQHDRDEWLKKTEELEKEVGELKHEKEGLLKKIELFAAGEKELSSEINGLLQDLKVVRSEKEELEERVKEMEQALKGQGKSKQLIEDLKNKYKEKEAQYQQQIEELKKANETAFNEERAKYQAEIDMKDQSIAAIEESCRQLKAQNEELQKELADKENLLLQYKDQAEELKNHQGKITELEKQLEQIIAAKDQLTTENSQLKQQLEERPIVENETFMFEHSFKAQTLDDNFNRLAEGDKSEAFDDSITDPHTPSESMQRSPKLRAKRREIEKSSMLPEEQKVSASLEGIGFKIQASMSEQLSPIRANFQSPEDKAEPKLSDIAGEPSDFTSEVQRKQPTAENESAQKKHFDWQTHYKNIQRAYERIKNENKELKERLEQSREELDTSKKDEGANPESSSNKKRSPRLGRSKTFKKQYIPKVSSPNVSDFDNASASSKNFAERPQFYTPKASEEKGLNKMIGSLNDFDLLSQLAGSAKKPGVSDTPQSSRSTQVGHHKTQMFGSKKSEREFPERKFFERTIIDLRNHVMDLELKIKKVQEEAEDKCAIKIQEIEDNCLEDIKKFKEIIKAKDRELDDLRWDEGVRAHNLKKEIEESVRKELEASFKAAAGGGSKKKKK